MDKRKVLLSIGVIIVTVMFVFIVTVCVIKRREPVGTETNTGGTIEMGLSEESSNVMDFADYTILIYGGKSNVTDAYLSEVVKGVEEIQSAFEEDRALGFVLMYPETDSCSVLAYGQRSELYFTDGVYSGWQGFELTDQVTEFTELQSELREYLK